ncbi:MAG TPA: two-component regulator propeller domain-containing protein [Chitinophagaceae bacterium]
MQILNDAPYRFFFYFRRMKKPVAVVHYICFIISCFVLTRAEGQSPKLFFQNYTTANGLCNNNIYSITQDSRGFIWIGTREGLSRFDGADFKNFFAGRDSSLSFPSNTIGSIIEYKPGHLAFSSGGRLWCMNTITGSFYQPVTPLAKKMILSLEQLPDKSLLFSSYDTIFITNSSLVITKKIVPGFSTGTYGAIKASFVTDDTLLLADGRNFALYSIRSGSIKRFTPDTRFSETEKITQFQGYDKKQHSLYFSNFWHGLLQYNFDGKTMRHFGAGSPDGKRLSSNQLLSLAEINDSILYIGTAIGLNILNKNTGAIEHIFHQADKESSPAGNAIFCFYKDREGNIWTGTTQGLSRINNINRIIKTIELPGTNTAQPAECYKIISGNDNDLYASIYGLGTYHISKINNSAGVIDNKVVPLAWGSMLSNNTLYIGGGGGQKKLAAYDIAKQKMFPVTFLDSYYGNADLVTLLYKDSHGDEWFSFNQGGGIARKPAGTNAIEHYSRGSTVPAFSFGYLTNATEDRQGNSWFSVNKSYFLLKWDDTKKTFSEFSIDTVTGIERPMPANIFYIWSGLSDTLWISYEGLGVAAYDVARKRARLLTIEDGLPTNYINSIVTDNKKRLWMGTLKGLVCYLPGEHKFLTFKKENGLPADKFSSSAIYFDKAGNELWISSDNLLLHMNPDELLAQNKKAIGIYVDEINMNGRKIDITLAPALKHDENNFQFQFTAADMVGGKELEFAYQLKGADPGWIYSGSKRSAIYSSLNPGQYSFRVRAKRKGDTEWTEIKEPFSFTIATPWWQTWGFRLTMVCAFIALVILVVRSYFKRRLEKQKASLEKQWAVDKERTRIATDMHDDFGASLSRIKFLSEKLQLQNQEGQKTNEDLGKISAYSDEMAEKMGEIVWALNQRYDSSGDLVSFCRSYASEYLEDKNIKLHFESSDTADIKINGEIRRNIFLVIKESLHNVVKHAHATEVKIHIHCDKELRVLIHDNGKGFDPSSVRPFANGIENMKKRIQETGGHITIKNAEGTMIIINIGTGIQQNTYR